ncbi:MAG TPA: N-acetylmuramoyl-L-alanine amidase [Polyangiaceae bacterium]|nr:N-acetylmuramoyl-L-alanine amidase [Polyangiaceae bacterium]
MFAGLGWSCHPRASGGTSADAAPAAAEPSEVARARALVAAPSGLPARPEVVALARAVEARAVREGAGLRAVALHATAAALFQKVWRVEGHEQDALEALALYRTAAEDPDTPGACDAALAAAKLAGDMAHDGATTYEELYRVERRFAARPADAVAACVHEADDALSRLSPFRPAPTILAAIDDSVVGQRIAAPADLASASPAASPPRIQRIEAWPGRDSARVVVVIDRPVPYRVGDEVAAGADLPHTFVELDGVDVGDAPRDERQPGIVTRIRSDDTSTGSRVSLDFDGRAWRRVFYMNEPYRVVIDVARRPPGAGGLRNVSRVALDPGHGGKDTGATGPMGLREKDVTLDVAHRVAPVLGAQGMQVVLTRDDDRFVPLEERTARANAFGADLFLSIHCNAAENRGRHGVEAYVLDFTRDEIAARLAARENDTSQAATSELAAILGDMRLADQAQRSTRLAHLVERSAVATLQMKYDDVADGGVHPAGFYVLVGARMPSVLFEMSYLSNAVEERRLASAEYRQLLADALVNAVKAYRDGR